jgi:L-threonylcarbamoyladenylate synthase
MTIDEACDALLRGRCVILPSDTVYGIAALAYDAMAVQSVFNVKGRAEAKRLPVHYCSLRQVSEDVILDERICKLVNDFMPGKLTIIANAKSDTQLSWRPKDVAFRIPGHPIVLEIIRRINQPITGTSANKTGFPARSTFKEIAEELGLNGIEDDASISGIPSTIVDCRTSDVKIVRSGAIDLPNLM